MDQLAIFGGSPVMPQDIQRTRWPRWTAAEIEELGRVLQQEQLFGCDAPQVALLQQEWSQRVGVPYCAALSSGTAALHAGLWAAGVGPGDEVLVPAYSFMASALAILHAGAVPVFVDVQRHSHNLDPAQIARHVTPRTKALIVVHLSGLPADMDEINREARRYSIAVIEDCAHAPGATYKGRSTGSLGDAAAFSLNGVKNAVAGEAGLFTTRHKEYFERLDGLGLRVTLNAPREDSKYPLATLGHNYRCSVVGATLARGQLARIDELNRIRQQNCERLTAQLKEIAGVIPPEVPADRTHVYHMYRVRFDPQAIGVDGDPSEFRARVVAALACEGVLLRSWMNWTLPGLPVFSDPAAFEARFPWRRTWTSDRVYNPAEYPEANRIVQQTSMVAEAPTAVSSQVIDYLAAGFRKVFSQIDKVLTIRLSEPLSGGALANRDEIRALAMAAGR
ncbi:MAG: DegT/DnrJ/EryC1/StrS family aminotransferase [Bryobacteraceae bacterium]